MSIRKRINLGMDMLKKKTTIICLAIVALTPWIIYDLIFYDVATARKLASFYASLATVIGVIWAIINVTNALQAYKNDRSMRKKEIINKLYERFLEDGSYELYEKIKINEPFELDTKNKKVLNRLLTLFDEIEYFKREKLFDDDIWEYIGCEIVNLSCHENVQQFLKQTEQQYLNLKKGKQEDMMPFTGFKQLVKDMPDGPDGWWFKDKPPLL